MLPPSDAIERVDEGDFRGWKVRTAPGRRLRSRYGSTDSKARGSALSRNAPREIEKLMRGRKAMLLAEIEKAKRRRRLTRRRPEKKAPIVALHSLLRLGVDYD